LPGTTVTRCGVADAFEPGLRRGEFRLQRQVDEIAGHRDVVRPLRLHVGDQRVQHLAAVIFVAVAGPVEIAERTLAARSRSRASGNGGRCGSDRCASVKGSVIRAPPHSL
jgi:hypothetical protein